MKRASTIALATVGLVLATSACTASTADDSGGGSGDTQTLVVASSVGLPTLDKEAFGGGQMGEVLTNLNESLVRWKPSVSTSDQGADLASTTEFVSGLCAEFAFSDDGLTFDCTLRDAVSQYGNTITSDDVAWSFEYAREAGGTTLGLMSTVSMDIENPVTVISEKEFQLNFTEKNTTALAGLTFPFFSPLDSVEVTKHATADDPYARDWLAVNSAGFGPYMVTSMTPNEEVRMEINPNYTSPADGVPLPTYGQVVYQAVPDSSTRAQLLDTGAAQVSKQLDLGMYPVLKDSDTVNLYDFPYNAGVVLYFDTQKAPFDDPRVRQAIACSIDKTEISEKTFYSVFKPLGSMLAKVPEATNEYDTCATPDPALAQSLLAEAGATDLQVTLTYSRGNSGQDAQDNATLIQSMLGSAGITVTTVEEPDASKFFTDAAAHQYDMFLFTIGSNVPDAGWHLGSWVAPDAALNLGNFSDPEITSQLQIVKTAAAGSDERTAAIKRVQEIIMSQNLAVPIVELTNQYAVSTSVCGIQGDPDDNTQWQFMHPCE